MRKNHLVASVLSFLGMAAVIGVNVLASCVIALGIVLAYGASLKLLLRSHLGYGVVTTVTSATLALLATTAVAGLVFLWSHALAQPFAWSLLVWSAIFGSGTTWALLATWVEERRFSAHALSAIRY